MNRKLFYTFIGLVILMLVYGCGELSDFGDRVNISILVAPSTAGTVLTSGGDEIGNTATFTAIANKNWQFAGWSGDVNSFENPLQIVLQDDVSLTANFSLFSNNYIFEITASDGESSVNLEFGQIPGATDLFDTGVDLETPPPPPGNTLYAWFESNERQLLRDFRNAFTDELTWNLEFQPGVEDSISFNWIYTEESFSGSLILMNSDSTIFINMFDEDEVKISSQETDALEIVYSFD